MADRDYGGLRAILDEAVEDRRWEDSKPPVACPHDGAVLEIRDGTRNCPMGDYRWNGF